MRPSSPIALKHLSSIACIGLSIALFGGVVAVAAAPCRRAPDPTLPHVRGSGSRRESSTGVPGGRADGEAAGRSARRALSGSADAGTRNRMTGSNWMNVPRVIRRRPRRALDPVDPTPLEAGTGSTQSEEEEAPAPPEAEGQEEAPLPPEEEGANAPFRFYSPTSFWNAPVPASAPLTPIRVRSRGR